MCDFQIRYVQFEMKFVIFNGSWVFTVCKNHLVGLPGTLESTWENGTVKMSWTSPFSLS